MDEPNFNYKDNKEKIIPRNCAFGALHETSKNPCSDLSTYLGNFLNFFMPEILSPIQAWWKENSTHWFPIKLRSVWSRPVEKSRLIDYYISEIIYPCFLISAIFSLYYYFYRKKRHLIIILTCIALSPREVKRILVYWLSARISSSVFASLSVFPSVTYLFLNYFCRSFYMRNNNPLSDIGIEKFSCSLAFIF